VGSNFALHSSQSPELPEGTRDERGRAKGQMALPQPRGQPDLREPALRRFLLRAIPVGYGKAFQ